jgi:hypothetical protein
LVLDDFRQMTRAILQIRIRTKPFFDDREWFTTHLDSPLLEILKEIRSEQPAHIELLIHFSPSRMHSNNFIVNADRSSALSRKSADGIGNHALFRVDESDPILSRLPILAQIKSVPVFVKRSVIPSHSIGKPVYI